MHQMKFSRSRPERSETRPLIGRRLDGVGVSALDRRRRRRRRRRRIPIGRGCAVPVRRVFEMGIDKDAFPICLPLAFLLARRLIGAARPIIGRRFSFVLVWFFVFVLSRRSAPREPTVPFRFVSDFVCSSAPRLFCFRLFFGSYFYGVLLSFTGFYWVLLGFTGYYWVLLFGSYFYGVLLSFTEFYWVLLGFTGFYVVLPRSSKLVARYRVFFTEFLFSLTCPIERNWLS